MVDVSVIIAARNESKYVVDAVRSVLNQEGLVHELVFVDDSSDDDTFEKVATLLDGTKHRLVCNPGRGKVSAFNFGVSIASGRWVCIFAGDDIMPPGSLAARLATVDRIQSETPVVGLSRLITMSDTKGQDGHIVPRDPTRGGLTGVSYLMDDRALKLMFPVPDNLPNEDTWLEVAVLHLGFTLVHSGIIGCRWRVHSGNSINMLVPFDQFNAKLTPRMGAYAEFLQRHGDSLSPDSRASLEAKVRCETARRAKSLAGILRSGATTKERLRAISLGFPWAYVVRQRLYGLLSGW